MNAKPKILIVDDRPENLKALRKVLKDLEIELVEATSGNDALKATLHHDFTLALLDIQMPEMDGYELAGLLREEEKTAHLPFIFISAVYTDNLNVFTGYEKGAFSFITKPFQPEILINKVKFFIDKHQQEITLLELNKELKQNITEITNFKSLFESAPGCFLILLPDFTIDAVSDEYLKATMTKREEILGRHLFEVFPDNPGDTSADGENNLRTSLNLVLKNKETHRMAIQKYDIRNSDGTFVVRYWSPLNKPVLNNKGEVVYLIHSVEDITVRLKQEQELKDSFKEISDYKYALDESSIVAITDQKGIIKEVNNNFCTISKYTREELIGQDHRMINSGYHTKEFMQDLWVTISSGKVWRGEVKNIAKDGTFYWLDTTIVPFLNVDGIPYQYMAIRSEITLRKDAVDQLQAVNKELEAFSYSVSHDLRAPLRAMNGYAEILKEDYGTKLDEEGKRIIETITDNSTRMGILIDDLLAFSRLGRKEIQKIKIDMIKMVEDVLNELNKSMTHNTKIKVGKLHEVNADYTLLHQVMFNLISNAVKYSSKKKYPVVEISSEETNGEIIFSVKDNGVGFDMRFAHKLFGIFQRLHKSKDFEGTGVGLAIVHRIISKHGGKVWAEAEFEKGATFNFVLPIN